MKIWAGYGSEHSMNLVMIGHFRSADEARETLEIIDMLSVKLVGKVDYASHTDRFTDDVLELLRQTSCYLFTPSEIEQFLAEKNTQLEGDKLILTTEESEISSFLKLMIHKGAKVEIFSGHDYPETGYGRGK